MNPGTKFKITCELYGTSIFSGKYCEVKKGEILTILESKNHMGFFLCEDSRGERWHVSPNNMDFSINASDLNVMTLGETFMNIDPAIVKDIQEIKSMLQELLKK